MGGAELLEYAGPVSVAAGVLFATCGALHYNNNRQVANELRRCPREGRTLPELRASLAELRTGDVLLFRSTGWIGFLSRVFERGLVHGSAWDHVGLVVRRDGARDSAGSDTQKFPARRACCDGYCTCKAAAPSSAGEPALELAESTGAGTHIYPLEERLAQLVRHHSYVAIRKRVGHDSTQVQLSNLQAFLEMVCGRAYEKHPEEMVHALCIPCCSSGRRELPKRRLQKLRLRGALNPAKKKDGGAALANTVAAITASAERRKHTAMAETMQSIFCGELVAASLQVLGLMRTEGITAHDFVPTDFSHDEYERGLFDKSLAPAKRGKEAVEYSPESLIIYPGAPYYKYLLRGIYMQRL